MRLLAVAWGVLTGLGLVLAVLCWALRLPWPGAVGAGLAMLGIYQVALALRIGGRRR